MGVKMKRNSYPAKISVNMLHELTGKDRGTIKRRLEGLKPIEQKTKGHYYDLKVALRYIYEPQIKDSIDEDSVFLNPVMEKAKLDRARRLSVELDNQIKKKELIPRQELKQTLGNIFGAVRSKLLNVPVKASQSLPENPSRKELQAHLKAQINEALKELSEKNFNESL